jgi:hypothetical protein
MAAGSSSYITREEAEKLILETYKQFSAPLARLNGISAGNGGESEKIRQIADEYRLATGGNPGDRDIGEKLETNLGPELKEAGHGELEAMMLECRDLARLYDLPVKHELPAEDVIIGNRIMDESPRYLSISFFQQDEKNDEKSLFLNGYFSHLHFDRVQQKIVWRILDPDTLTEELEKFERRREIEAACNRLGEILRNGAGEIFNTGTGHSNLTIRLLDDDRIVLVMITLNGERKEIFTSVDAVVQDLLPKRHPDGFLYFDNTQAQAMFGYHNFYENFTRNEEWCDIDSLRTNFINSEGKRTAIWLWKGDYNMALNDEGWCVGAEIGAYVNEAANDHILESGQFTLTKTDGTVLIHNRTVNNQYWINAFVKGRNDIAANLVMEVSITFYELHNAIQYENAINVHVDQDINRYFSSNVEKNGTLQNRSYEDIKLSEPQRDDKTVKFTFQ